MRLELGLTLAPGERKAVRFEFREREYLGTLILRGPGGFYREYALPAAGLGPHGFGVGPDRGKIVAVWNSTDQPLAIEWYFLQAIPPADGKAFGDFARIRVADYVPDRLPVRTLGLIPYRAEVETVNSALLETPRLYLPGYEATVNGVPVAVTASPAHHVMLPVGPGRSEVELRYRGTSRQRWTQMISLLCWLGVVLWAVRRSTVFRRFFPRGARRPGSAAATP